MIVEKGNEKEMLIYGKTLFKGVKTAENKRKAIEYCKKCADLDIEEAIFLNASILYDGNGLSPNKQEAEESADNGNLISMFYYESMLYIGKDIPKKCKRSI